MNIPSVRLPKGTSATIVHAANTARKEILALGEKFTEVENLPYIRSVNDFTAAWLAQIEQGIGAPAAKTAAGSGGAIGT